MSRSFTARAPLQLWLGLAASAIFLLSATLARAQGAAGTRIGPANQGEEDITEAYHQGASLQVTVVTEDKTKLDRQIGRAHV